MKADNSHKMKSKKQTREQILLLAKMQDYYERGQVEYFSGNETERLLSLSRAKGIIKMHKLLKMKGK